MVKEKMVKLHSDIEDAAMTKFHLETKVQRLTEAGIDEDSVTPLPEQVRSPIHCRIAGHHNTVHHHSRCTACSSFAGT
jgi:hypothetical protein